MISEKDYLKLCKACKYVLTLPDSTIERVAIPWLHIIREHPVVLAKYRDILFSSKSPSSSFSGLKSYFIRKALWYRQIIKTLIWDGSPWFGSATEKVDFLFISHLINPEQFSQKQDFYFSNIPEDLINLNRTVAIAYISHFSGHYTFFKKLFVKSNVPHLYFSGSLRLSDEINIRKCAKLESWNLRASAKTEDRDLCRKVLLRASKEVLSADTHGTLRLISQIQKLIKKLRPKVIVLPYEGHAFERVIFASARQISPDIKCISYQHTGVFRLSNAIRQTLSPQYNPDMILVSGSDGKSALEDAIDLKGIPIEVLGSARGLINYEINPDALVKSPPYGCLVIPEGFDFECMSLFRFSLLCAKLRPDIKYIWRLHPSLSFEKLRKCNSEFKNLPGNIVLSSDTIENDIAQCSWALYRGTTAIYKAISAGLRPIYLSLSPEMTIDPLYKMTDWRMIIDSPDDFIKCINSDIEKDMYFHKINLNRAREICENQFAKINISVLNKIIPG